MLDHDQLIQWIKRAKRGPLCQNGVAVAMGRDALETLLPHRSGMLLLDRVEMVNLAERSVRSSRKINAGDVGLEGHFPSDPIYPGVLLIEAIAQTGLCLLQLVRRGSLDFSSFPDAPAVRATHVHYAAFASPVRPGDELILEAQVLADDYLIAAMGQAWVGSNLAAYTIFEAMIDE